MRRFKLLFIILIFTSFNSCSYWASEYDSGTSLDVRFDVKLDAYSYFQSKVANLALSNGFDYSRKVDATHPIGFYFIMAREDIMVIGSGNDDCCFEISFYRIRDKKIRPSTSQVVNLAKEFSSGLTKIEHVDEERFQLRDPTL